MDPWDVKIVNLFTMVHQWMVVEVELWVGHMDLHKDANTRDVKMVNLVMTVRSSVMVHAFTMMHPWVTVPVGPWVHLHLKAHVNHPSLAFTSR